MAVVGTCDDDESHHCCGREDVSGGVDDEGMLNPGVEGYVDRDAGNGGRGRRVHRLRCCVM